MSIRRRDAPPLVARDVKGDVDGLLHDDEHAHRDGVEAVDVRTQQRRRFGKATPQALEVLAQHGELARDEQDVRHRPPAATCAR